MPEMIRPILMLCVLLVVTGCAGKERDTDFTRGYLAALEELPGSAQPMDEGVERFMSLFSRLGEDDLSERIQDVYAERLFFNDTLNTFTERDALKQYLVRTGKSLDGIEVELLGFSQSGPDLYLRWTMETRLRILGRKVAPRTQGMTHLRFNDEGRIILQQDFWDSSRGFFEHVPVTGGMIRWLRERI